MLSKLFGKDYGFFELFNRHAATTVEATEEFISYLKNHPENAKYRERIETLEHDGDNITHMTVDLLHQTFITPLDRDEIIKLISRLDDVLDTIHVATKRTHMFEVKVIPKRLIDMAAVLQNSMGKVKIMVEMVNGFKEIEKTRELAKQIHQYENEGDQIFNAGITELFKESASDPLNIIKLKEVYEAVEMAIDRCEDVANIIEGLYLEHV